ncbi:MAG: hypothetical protein K8I30_13275, partial [Anaerolineae bacterium]|nr:hypothetical protein [Anaerolineae bacterium]
MMRKVTLFLAILILLNVIPALAQSDATAEATEGTTGIDDLPIPVGGMVTGFQQEAIDAMGMAGMTWVSRQVFFTSNDPKILTQAQDYIETGHEAGFKVLLWIRDSQQTRVENNDGYYAAFSEFLAQVAAFHPEAIQIWDEMNSNRSWVKASVYADLLKGGYEAIKAADPDVMVITGPLLPVMFYGSCNQDGCNDDQYYAEMAQAGVADYADCIGVRYFEGTVAPDETKGDARGEIQTYYFPTMIERAAEPFKDQDIPLCFTQLGYFSAEGYDGIMTFPGMENTTVEDQANWLRDAIQIANDDGRIALLIIFTMDRASQNLNDLISGWAIIRPDGT